MTTAAVALLLALGYALTRAPVEWTLLLRLLLPVAVALLALCAGKTVALVGSLLALVFLLPGLIQAANAGSIPELVYGLAMAALCLLAPFVASPERLRAHLERHLAQRIPGADVIGRPLRRADEDSLDQQVEELAVLQEITRTIGASLNLRTTLEAILTSARRLIAFDMAEITLWDPYQQHLVSRGSLDAEAYHAEVGQTYRLGEGYSGWLAQHRRPLLIPDIPSRKDVRPKLDRPDDPFRSYMGIPLERVGEFIGTLELISYRPTNFSPHDLEILQTIGLQAAVAVENARLYQETQQRAAELISLADVSAAVTSTLDLDQVLDTITNSVLEVVGCQSSAIFVLDEEIGLLRLAATRGLSESYVDKSQTITIERGGRAHAVAVGEPLIVENIAADSSLRPLAPLAEEEGVQAFADLPLRAGGRVIGMLSALFVRPHHFGELERDILAALADQAAAAIENARLYTQADQELHRRTVALAGLQRVGRELSATFDQDHILRLVMEEVIRLSEVTHSAIILKDPDGDKWQLALCTGYLEEEQAALRQYLSTSSKESLIEKVAQTGQSVRVDVCAAEHPMGGLTRARSVLLVPIWYGDAPTGIILQESTKPEAFDEEMQGFVEGLAAQAAIAIGNARRYQEELARSSLLRRQADQLSHILEISQAVRSDQPLEEVLEEIAYAVQESVGFGLALINILEGDPPRLRRVAGAGLPVDILERMKRTPQPWTVMEVVIQEEFRISQSYYVPAEQQTRWRGVLDVYDAVQTEIRREPGCWHPHDLLIVPLLGPESEVRGTLSVDEPRDGKVPDRSTIEALEVFAAQAAVAVENARLVEALQRRLDLLTYFNELNRAVTAKLDLGGVLQIVVEATVRLIHCDGSALFLLDEQSNRYVPLAAYGHDLAALKGTTFASGEGLVGGVVASGMPLTVSDVEEEIEGPDYIQRGAAILIPLDIGGRVVGVLTADRTYKKAFSSTDVATLIALADQVALAVQNARLFDETVRRTDELSTLLEATSALSSTLDLQWMLQALGERLLAVAGAERCRISEWDREPDLMTVVWEVGKMEATHSRIGVTYAASERPSAMAEVLLLQEPLTLEAADLWSDLETQAQEKGTGSVLLLPMVARGQTVGLVEIEQPGEGRGFTPREIRLAQALANQAAVAIQNARLFEEARRFSEELEQRVEKRTQELAHALEELTTERDRVETLYRIASELSTSLDLDRVLNRTLEMVTEAVGATQGIVLLRDLETDQLFCRALVGSDFVLPPGGTKSALPRGQGLAWWVITHGEPVIVDDIQEDSRWVALREQGQDNRRACLAIPLAAAGEAQGTLLLYHNVPGSFTIDHLRLVEAAASQVSNAISNVALYNLIRDQAEQLGAMLKQQQVEAAKSQAILEGVADGVMVADAQGRVILFNAAAEHVLDIPRQQVLGRSTSEMMGLYGTEGRAWMAAIDEWAANPADRAPGDFTAEQLQVGDRIASIHVSPVIRGTEYLGTVSVFRDITAVVEADRAKSDFVSTVSHELRTPMTSIKGYADLLLMGAVGELSDQQRHFMNIIRNNANRLTALVNDLLDISRIETGRMELRFGMVPIIEIVEQVISTLGGRAQERNLVLETQVPAGLPAVWADDDRVTQILTNLVGNAVQYTPAGGSVTVSARVREEMLEVSVTDTGIGISKENVNKLFAPFFRADDPHVQETSGTGLGLAITASLVHMHGGEIWVESELGEGSCFNFTLPLARPVPSARTLASSTSAHVLVVEDDQDVANLIRIHLESQGHEVVIAGRGDEALHLAQEIQPALITLDIRLPDADGFDVLQQLRKNSATASIPVVIVSVMTSAEESLRLGAVGYVAKPIDEVALLNTVQQVLDGKGLILVVEDDRDNLALMRDALKQQGFSVRTTRRGRRALRVAREVQPALILLDMKLEDMDGYQVLRSLKSHSLTQDIPIVVITGSLTQEELRQEVLALGAARFLTKPFAVEELIQEITAVLAYSEAQGETGR